MEKLTKIIMFLLILIVLEQFVFASSEFELRIDSKIISDDFTAISSFFAGAKDSALDGIDIYDGRMVEAPSYSIPMYSIISGEYLMVDYRQTFQDESEVWHITQKGSSEFRWLDKLNETVTWDISDVPEGINLTLIDYGADSARTTKISEINLIEKDSYTFEVNQPYGDYRYFDLTAKSYIANENTATKPIKKISRSKDNDEDNSDDNSGSSNEEKEPLIFPEKNDIRVDAKQNQDQGINNDVNIVSVNAGDYVYRRSETNPLIGLTIILFILIIGLIIVYFWLFRR